METTRYDEKLTSILRQSAAVFAEKGFHRASIRDISAASGVSLSGLYYYFRSKEELLYLIQRHCFERLLTRVRAEVADATHPEERLERFIRSHLGFFVSSMPEMKVLSHEADSLSGEFRTEVSGLKRAYSEELTTILSALHPEGGVPVRTATFGLFGMMNWVYNWYRPDRDPPADELAREMTRLFLRGYAETGRDTPPRGNGTKLEEGGDEPERTFF